ncbi:dimethylsulfonioproprionate lyase family protein [uncultured Tateyamaria sp.]|uniref:dimethylsulfonioproprionate lyase family protein n=1 Tax=uncultured Tateyamaria sp. TaxID=455651 RepID=UPI0026115235|nr:dimethylsulfonioproprionate lyase family protein [uncultured Tateyamaria sp.]
MDAENVFEPLLHTTQAVCRQHPDVRAFVPFPTDVTPQPVTPKPCPCSTYMTQETGWDHDPTYEALSKAIIRAGPHAHWRETYKNTDIGDHFMDRFGCYCIIGPEGPFTSQTARVFMVYMPPHLYYPWHHHPAEELYLVLSGAAIFCKADAPDTTLRAGDVSFHESNQSHAMETRDDPVLCLVLWRNEFDTPPVLSAQAKTTSAKA